MIHLKTYENWFTNIFKSSNDMWQKYMDDHIGNKFKTNYNALVGAAEEGNWSRFKYLLPKYINQINDIIIVDNKYKTNLLMTISGKSDIGFWEKKKMITALLDNNVNLYFKNKNGDNFYDIMDPKLKMWFEEKYPDIVEKLNIDKNINKYNI